MNKIASLLIILGIVQIIVGLLIGIATHELMWIWLGIISGVIILGLAEMINILQQNRDIAKEQLGVLKGQFLPENENSAKDAESEDDVNQEIDDGYDDLRNELKAQGHERDYIEATVAIRKRLDKK
ncbi:hypothetical protein [Paucisalibacillus globulus]|uniref:hypothetical protein n=1 Tax=Paucisalibacillus globulus TaxID=351095 RepID=UPI000BB85297|nr:hypothetical protein [Paucisalibacillus globulus]